MILWYNVCQEVMYGDHFRVMQRQAQLRRSNKQIYTYSTTRIVLCPIYYEELINLRGRRPRMINQFQVVYQDTILSQVQNIYIMPHLECAKSVSLSRHRSMTEHLKVYLATIDTLLPIVQLRCGINTFIYLLELYMLLPRFSVFRTRLFSPFILYVVHNY